MVHVPYMYLAVSGRAMAIRRILKPPRSHETLRWQCQPLALYIVSFPDRSDKGFSYNGALGMCQKFPLKTSNWSKTSRNSLHHMIEHAWRYTLIYKIRTRGFGWNALFLENITNVYKNSHVCRWEIHLPNIHVYSMSILLYLSIL